MAIGATPAPSSTRRPGVSPNVRRSDAEHQLVALAEDRGEHRLSLEHRGVHLEAIETVDVDVGGLRQGEKAPEHVTGVGSAD